MKRIINYISQNKASYFPEALILDVYKLSGLSFILLVSSPLLVISGLKNLATITLSLSIVVLIITLYRIYITYFGKWVLIKATCISIPKQSKLKPKFINTKNMVVQANHEKPTKTETFVIPIGISNNNFTEGMHLDIYISASTPVYKKNGLTVVSGTLKIVPKEQ